jgi:alpha-L-arabinofuranosidase
MEKMGPYVENFSDLVEYANGPVDSTWGKLRAAAGHPAPFGLRLMEIGNENTGPVYRERYNMIFSSLKEKHPEIQTIADERMRGGGGGNTTVEMVDEHHYADPNWFVNNEKLYDNADRRVPLYLGEVAVTSGNAGTTRGNLLAALAEGTYLMGAERNADVVKMVSYAPLLANVDGRTDLPTAPPPYWHGMIYFDSLRSYGTVSYYLWKTFGLNVPSVNLATTVDTDEKVGGIAGNVGVGTWGTSAEFKDIQVEHDGKVVYASDFAKAGAGDEWTTESGRWSVQDGVYRQSSNANGLAYIGDENWTDYTISLKARKLSGGEGFLVAFGHKGSDKYWWNVGGWGNTRNEIELNQAVVGRPAMMPQGTQAVETGRWYDVKIEVKGRHVKCWLDGELVHDVEAPLPPSGVVAIAGRDEKAGELVVKVINRTGKAVASTINLAGAKVESAGKVTVLTSGSLQDNNSLDQPMKVAPVEKELTGVSEKFGYEAPAYSLSVIRVREGK